MKAGGGEKFGPGERHHPLDLEMQKCGQDQLACALWLLFVHGSAKHASCVLQPTACLVVSPSRSSTFSCQQLELLMRLHPGPFAQS